VLARDRLGVKPLYWSRVGDLVVFASELKALLASGLVTTRLDVEALDLYLTLGYVPGPRTPLAGVHKLAPGGLLVVEEGSVRESRYWKYPEPAPERRVRPLDEYADELLELLEVAVRDRLMSDVPLGAMLSGGLDSSLVVALMAKESDRPVETFSVGFREDARSELADARRVAELFGCEHHELELSVTADTLSLDELVWHLDEPVADLSTLGFDVLSRLAAEHVTVAQAGQGADELFGGYPKHRAAAALSRLSLLPDVGRRMLARLPLPGEKLQRAARALATDDPTERLLAFSGRLDERRRNELYRGPLAALDGTAARHAVEAARNGVVADPLSTTLYLDAKLALVDHMLLYFDKASMAHSLEVRVPYLDHRLVEWAATVPPAVKVDRGVTKRVLKHAGARLLPPAVVEKQKVGFFRFALDPWLVSQLDGEAGERLRAPEAPWAELLAPSAVSRLVSDYRREQTEERARLVLAILMLDSWLTTFRDRTRASVAL
jgi:asparagine synthase (glutamine-hydrolysing)